ncbi:MAG: exo-alpha-sialidase [Candidatus Anammoximicrobium sp.]|nr:exo-alpha-sialidase [Candidatus Anammoximicrobium sp.]
MFTLEDQGLVFDAARQPPDRRIAYFTSLCPLRSGQILCGFQNGPGKHAASGTVRLCRSPDGGQSWALLPLQFQTRWAGVPGSLAAAEMVEVEPGRLLLFSTWFDRRDPERPLFDPVTEGILKSKQLLALSRDDGLSWSDWRELPTGDLRGCSLTGPVLRWHDGAIAVALESFKEFDDPRPGRHAAWLLVSRDGGESFSPPMLVAQHPEHKIYYWDQRLCPGARAGEFTALFWTHDLAEKRDLAVHLRRGAVTRETLAVSPLRATQIPGQIAAPLRLDDGRLLAFVVDRGRPGTMTLWCSHDNGQTWPRSARLVVYTHDEHAAITQGRENIDFKQYWEDMGKWSFGHPAIRPLAEGRVLLAWYAGTPDTMSLHWARIRVA